MNNKIGMNNAIALRPPVGSKRLEDNAQWTNRFEVRSETSNRLYIIAQNKASGKFSCSCPGWISHRTCKHLLFGCQLTTSQIHGHDRLEEKRRAKVE